MRLCSVPGCIEKHKGLGYCIKHLWQMNNYGKILDRTYRDRNEIVVEDDVAKMKLYDKLCNITGETIFDSKYVDDIKDFKWHIKNDDGYVVTNYTDKSNGHHQIIKLHQAIISLSGKIVESGKQIDHKDRNKLNNMENNLRICTPNQNSQNREKRFL